MGDMGHHVVAVVLAFIAGVIVGYGAGRGGV
jgi:hypothetical protein